MRTGPPPLRYQAAISLLERIYGRPLTQVEMEVRHSGQVDHRHSLANWSDDELEALAAMKGMLLAQTVEGEIVEGELADGATLAGEASDGEP